MKRKKKTFKIIVEKLPRKRFEKAYGKKTQGVTKVINPKSKRGAIHIRKGLTPKRTKRTIQHEIGHIISDKANLKRKLSKEQKKELVKFAKEYISKERIKEPKKELIQEALATLYERARTGTEKEKRIIRRDYTKFHRILNKAKERLNVRVIRK